MHLGSAQQIDYPMHMIRRCVRWAMDRVYFFTDTLTLLDLMRLAEDEGSKWQEFVTKAYDWEHTRRVEVGKWLLALAAALVAAIFAVVGKADTLPAYVVPLAGVGAGIFAGGGIITIWSARRIPAHLARTTALVSRFVAIRTFLTRVRQEEGL